MIGAFRTLWTWGSGGNSHQSNNRSHFLVHLFSDVFIVAGETPSLAPPARPRTSSLSHQTA